MYHKEITYDRLTRDYAMFLDNELVGFARTYHTVLYRVDRPNGEGRMTLASALVSPDASAFQVFAAARKRQVGHRASEGKARVISYVILRLTYPSLVGRRQRLAPVSSGLS